MSDFNKLRNVLVSISSEKPSLLPHVAELISVIEKQEGLVQKLRETSSHKPTSPKRIAAVKELEDWMIISMPQWKSLLEECLVEVRDEIETIMTLGNKAIDMTDKLSIELKKESKDG